ETDTPAGHVVALAHGEEFHRDFAGPFHLHDGRRHITVEGDVRVRQVVHDQDVVLAREGHDSFEERQIDALGGRIAGKTQDHHLGARNRFAYGALDLFKEVEPRHDGYRADVGSRDHRAIDVNRIAGVGYQHRVAAIECREHQVGQTFLRADRNDGFGIRIDLDVVATLIPA